MEQLTNKEKKIKVSPMITQYQTLKEQYPDTIIFFRLGDFYEFFFEDAIAMSKELDLTLTGKDCGLGKENKAPMCGIPYHSANTYIQKLVDKGYKVGICEQMTNIPAKGQKIVQRELVRIITPGTVIEEDMLDEQKNNFIVCMYCENDVLTVAYSELSKGEFNVTSFAKNEYEKINNFLQSISPSEIIVDETCLEYENILYASKLELLPKFTKYDSWAFLLSKAESALVDQFGKNYEAIFDLQMMTEKKCCGALIQYLQENQKKQLVHINKITKINEDGFMVIDTNTRRNLEIIETMKDKKKKGSLLWLLDQTNTAMGARLLRTNVLRPLYNEKQINARLDSVEELVKKLIVREELISNLKRCKDIERIIGRIACSSLNPKHLVDMTATLNVIPKIKKLLINFESKNIVNIQNNIADFDELEKEISMMISESASANMKDGGYVKRGYNAELDRLRDLSENTMQIINNLEQHEREQTGIKNLKIKYNRVFGYFIEINRSQVANVPYHYIRRQTISNNERYVTEELKNLEEEIIQAKENAQKLELQIFAEIRKKLVNRIPDLQNLGKALSELDFYVSLATLAIKNNYIRPKIKAKTNVINIVDGRHPVVEALIKNNQFIVNDTFLNTDTDKTMIITGPNMAGKSTYMRQVALITLMAHIGSFVPARSAEISLTDRIFTRVGASDDLAFGQSTFMVEMTEVANILHNATKNSLIVLDEIGRGTSTFDGLSIAWAVVEFLSQKMSAKTLFATHYHELTELEGFMQGVKNYKITLKEFNGNIIFLRKIIRGGANKSFGIEVAALAGLPKDVIDRAKEISLDLENSDITNKLSLPTKQKEFVKPKKDYQEVIGVLSDLQIERLSPLSAFEILRDLAEKVQK